MKKWSIILISILILLFTITYKYSKFDLTSSSSFSKETIILGENYYLGYGLEWNSIIKPTLQNIELRNKDGLILGKDQDQIEITPYIDIKQHTGALDDSVFIEDCEKDDIEYVAVNEAKIGKYNTLVLRIMLKDNGYIDTATTMILKYHILGIPKQQSIEFDGFFTK